MTNISRFEGLVKGTGQACDGLLGDVVSLKVVLIVLHLSYSIASIIA